MSEKRILLASLLKPVNDTRMFEKLGLSLATVEGIQVHIAGFFAPLPTDAPDNITFHPLFNFKRLSTGRAKAQLHYWKLLHSLKPDLILVCTHELLLTSVLYKKLYKCKLIYDIQENYSLNLVAQQNYSFVLKQLLAGGVASVENLTARATDHFLLAERSYVSELHFIGSRYTVIENKFKPPVNFSTPVTPVKLKSQGLNLLYTGTIATLYGIFEAVELADSLYQFDKKITLTIMGYCASRETLLKLRSAIKGKPYITLIGGEKPVPHQDILNAMKHSDIGLMPYHYNKSIFNCIPTKLYEYTAMGLPVLIQHNPIWDNIIKKYKSGLPIDFKHIDISSLIATLLNKQFYQKGIPNDVFWASEEQKLLSVAAQFS